MPEQPDPKAPAGWQEIRVQGTDGLAVRASKKLRNEDMLVTQLAGHPLRRELDKIPLWPEGVNHVSVRQLMDYYAQYLYLSRLKDTRVLLDAIQEGTGLMTWQQDAFAYADGWDEAEGRYQGLRAGQIVSVNLDGRGLIVKPDAAIRQLEAERSAVASIPSPAPTISENDRIRETGASNGILSFDPPAVSPKKTRRFHGSVTLDATRLGHDAGKIGEEVVQHLVALIGTKARITLEIEVDATEGFPDGVVRTVTENCRTLKFLNQDFEEE